ncbi:hypothetical protein ACFVR2_15625 [Gottfriedia sp. NPDC057991]|uniref:hypothetical protein n=1 Tax=Gottfriedia sp. NPDC057991 TaxID=3346298 RepID=UPI0036DDF924
MLLPGFFGFISREKNVLDKNIIINDIIDQKKSSVVDELVVNTSNLYGKIFRNTVTKFQKDKTFIQVQDNFFVLDGVLLNKKNLYEKYEVEDDNINSLLSKITLKNPKTFYKEFRGTFAGLYINNDQVILYTNHIGDKEIFYHISSDEKVLYFSTDFEVLVKLANIHGNHIFNLNTNAAYSLMTHSHVLCNETLLKNVHRLTPGHYIQYTKNNFKKVSYYLLENSTVSISEQEALDKLNYYFRKAVKRSFEKDLEYGYKHLVALSGGLDSRMTAWVAYDMGYTNMLNYTFSQTDYYDETIPKQITSKLKTEWMFKALDNGTYLYKYFDESIKVSGARSQSSTLSHTMSMIENINLDNYGIIHTGQLGDVIIGTFYDKGKRKNFARGDGAYSTKLIDKVVYTKENAFNIDDQEMFKFYNRGFTGVNTGLKPMYQYTETVSPFLDVDFLDFCLSLPLEYRSGHKIYIKWINQYYPEAANFIYEKVQGKINRKIINVKGVPLPWTSIPSAAIKLLKKKLGIKLSSKRHMNPMDFWYKNNKYLRNFYEEQFMQNINLVKDRELKSKSEFLYKNGSTLEKDKVITFLGFIKRMKHYIE